MGIKHIKLFVCFSVFIATGFFNLHAQEIEITGNVTSSEDEQPIPGVTILVEGTTKGTTTDFDGAYSINAKKGDVLVFSYVGFSEQKKIIGNNPVVNIQLVDVLGEIIIDKEKISDQFVINANQLKAATYFLIVDNDGVQTTSKISVVKD